MCVKLLHIKAIFNVLNQPALRKNFYAALVMMSFIFLSQHNLKGQDIHYSQFYNSPLNINPALTGVFNGDVRVVGSMRDQWRQIPVPYTTFSANYDQKYYTKNRDKGFFGFGAIFNYDRSGDPNYNIMNLNLTGSYSYLINSNNVLTGGLLLGFASEGFDGDQLTWDNYWTGTVIDETLGSGENFDGQRVNYLESGIGINYRYQKSSRTYLNLGVGAWHLIPPNLTFLANQSRLSLPVRYAVNFETLFKTTEKIDIQLHGIYARQQRYQELLAGGLLRFHINQNPGKKYAVDLGLSYRFAGDLIPIAALHYNQWYIGASYDFNLTGFHTQHDINRLGGPEVHVRYIITNVKPLNEKKACPIY